MRSTSSALDPSTKRDKWCSTIHARRCAARTRSYAGVAGGILDLDNQGAKHVEAERRSPLAVLGILGQGRGDAGVDPMTRRLIVIVAATTRSCGERTKRNDRSGSHRHDLLRSPCTVEAHEHFACNEAAVGEVVERLGSTLHWHLLVDERL